MKSTGDRELMSRSQFLRYCAAGVVGSCAVATLGLQSCSSVPMLRAQQVQSELVVPLSAFEHTMMVQVERTASLPADILVVKDGAAFRALLMRCTHKGCQVQAEGQLLVCPCHGSEFSLSGEVLSPPASRNLDSYPTRFDGTQIYIRL